MGTIKFFFDLFFSANNPIPDQFFLNIFLNPVSQGQPLLVCHAAPPNKLQPGQYKACARKSVYITSHFISVGYAALRQEYDDKDVKQKAEKYGIDYRI